MRTLASTARVTAPVAFAVLAGIAADVGCAHNEPYEPKKRNFEPGEYASAEGRHAGSLFDPAGRGLAEDDRAMSIGDVIIIRVDEADSASHDSTTKLDRKSAQTLGISGALDKKFPHADIAHLLGANSEYQFAGGGRIQRHGQLNAMLPVRVQKVLPNGDLYVEGTKVVLLGEEERHLSVSGIVRQADIRFDGSVLSSRIADAEIEYSGRGDASDQQERGWLSRVIAKVWPF